MDGFSISIWRIVVQTYDAGHMNPALTAQLSAISALQAELKTRMADIDDRIVRVGRLARQEVPEPIEPPDAAVPVPLPEPRPSAHPAPLPQPCRPMRPVPVAAPALPAAPRETVAKDHALEIRVGTYWLARV